MTVLILAAVTVAKRAERSKKRLGSSGQAFLASLAAVNIEHSDFEKIFTLNLWCDIMK